jgi:hypothetical protein
LIKCPCGAGTSGTDIGGVILISVPDADGVSTAELAAVANELRAELDSGMPVLGREAKEAAYSDAVGMLFLDTLAEIDALPECKG